jgi:hypothetical protein
MSIHTDKGVEIAAPLLTRKGAEKRLIARRRAEQVQTGYTWTTDRVYLGNRWKSRRELRQRDKYGHLQAAQSSKAAGKTEVTANKLVSGQHMIKMVTYIN